MKAVGMLIAAVPFAFAGIRLATTGNDFRYLWMAAASTFCAVAILARPSAPAVANGWRIGLAAISAALGAAGIAIALGARAGPGIAIVAGSFGLCSAVGTGLAVRARTAKSHSVSA